MYLVLALVAALCIWAYWAEVDKIVETQGKLIVEDIQIVQAASNAPVRSIEVQFGQIVSRGQVLATLDPTFSVADVAALEARLESSSALHTRLQAENHNEVFEITGHEESLAWKTQFTAFVERQKEYNARLEEFASERSKFNIQMTNNSLEISNQEETVKTFKELLDRYERLLENQNVSEIKVLDTRLQHKQKATELETLRGKTKEIEADINALEKREKAYIAGWRAEIAKMLTEVAQTISETTQELNKAKRAQDFVEIVVPVDSPYDQFYVFEVADSSLGSVVKPGDPLFKLVPLGAPLQVQIEIPGKDIGQVHTQEEVRIKLASFPYQRHGFLSGTIRTISEGSFEKETAPGMPPISTYHARVDLTDKYKLENVPENFRLLPGMSVEAEIVVGKRKVYEYFLYPLLQALDSAAREP
ncbi:MAG: HlyD family type I secretion periplasmic adaptor subunit [Pirellulaceae bacterium]